jgi:hypothetical protein
MNHPTELSALKQKYGEDCIRLKPQASLQKVRLKYVNCSVSSQGLLAVSRDRPAGCIFQDAARLHLHGGHVRTKL